MKLTKPIQAHDVTHHELTFREPTGADLARNGFPFKYETDGGRNMRVMDTTSIAKYISDLAAIPPSSVAQLNVIDFTRAMGEVLGFFMDAETQPIH